MDENRIETFRYYKACNSLPFFSYRLKGRENPEPVEAFPGPEAKLYPSRVILLG